MKRLYVCVGWQRLGRRRRLMNEEFWHWKWPVRLLNRLEYSSRGAYALDSTSSVPPLPSLKRLVITEEDIEEERKQDESVKQERLQTTLLRLSARHRESVMDLV